jgi:hypothetical protein
MSEKKEKRKSGLFGRKKGSSAKAEDPPVIPEGEATPSPETSKKSKRKSVSLMGSKSSDSLESEPKDGRKRVSVVCTLV